MIDLPAIKEIESGGDPRAWNKRTDARGAYQITKPCLDEYNEFNCTSYSMDDMFEERICYAVSSWYVNKRIPSMLIHYEIPDMDLTRLMAYNWGIGNLVKWWESVPKETRNYYTKYLKLK